MGNSALSGLIIPLLWIGGMIVVLSLVKLFGKKRVDSDDADDSGNGDERAPPQ